TQEHGMTFIPPFDHPSIIEGQATVAVEILDDIKEFTTDAIDYIFVPIGGGGLCAGMGYYFNEKMPSTKIIGLEPEGAPSMLAAIKEGHPIELQNIDKFVDGASVKRVGDHNFSICKDAIYEMHLVPEGKICTTILQMYNEEAIVVEPAGAMSIAALDDYAEQIKGKTIVCIVSGGNNDIARMQEIKERSLIYEGLKHYFLIQFAQRPGSLKEFVNKVLGPNDDITRFEYIQKHNKEGGPALVGLELKAKEDYGVLIENMKRHQINYNEINKDDNIYGYLI
ncbi:MAG: threonine ammonia-lyase IlvA, partial [Sediminibacterium sp.]